MSADPPADPPDAPRWLSPAAAGRLLGLTERTIRRRVQAGRLPSRRAPDGHLQVAVPPDAPSGRRTRAPDVSETSDLPPDVAPDAVRALTDLLHEERAALELERSARSQAEQAAAMWQERARNLEAQVDQLLALPAHVEDPLPPPWWRRLLRRR